MEKLKKEYLEPPGKAPSRSRSPRNAPPKPQDPTPLRQRQLATKTKIAVARGEEERVQNLKQVAFQKNQEEFQQKKLQAEATKLKKKQAVSPFGKSVPKDVPLGGFPTDKQLELMGIFNFKAEGGVARHRDHALNLQGSYRRYNINRKKEHYNNYKRVLEEEAKVNMKLHLSLKKWHWRLQQMEERKASRLAYARYLRAVKRDQLKQKSRGILPKETQEETNEEKPSVD